VEFMVNESECNERVHIEQICHGKFVKISSTSLLLKTGASEPALSTGSPVTRSVTILTWYERFLWGVNTIRPASMLASSGSPARMPSLRRRGPGRTTCPFVETLVCMVRQSYLPRRLVASRGSACPICWTSTPELLDLMSFNAGLLSSLACLPGGSPFARLTREPAQRRHQLCRQTALCKESLSTVVYDSSRNRHLG
jgi:hypothetical protein